MHAHKKLLLIIIYPPCTILAHTDVRVTSTCANKGCSVSISRTDRHNGLQACNCAVSRGR